MQDGDNKVGLKCRDFYYSTVFICHNFKSTAT